MMQVAQVQLSREEGFDLGNSYVYLLLFKIVVNPDG